MITPAQWEPLGRLYDSRDLEEVPDPDLLVLELNKGLQILPLTLNTLSECLRRGKNGLPIGFVHFEGIMESLIRVGNFTLLTEDTLDLFQEWVLLRGIAGKMLIRSIAFLYDCEPVVMRFGAICSQDERTPVLDCRIPR